MWAEGPHIYKRDGYYYLMISEGGTSFDHAMAIAISKDITGPYESNARNPVLTHRHLSYDYPISGVGHADLVELEDGRWYAVALGWRLVDGKHGILGRETFLVPVIWETEPYEWKEERLSWPVFSPDTGRVELRFPAPFGDPVQQREYAFRDDFNGDILDIAWNYRRTPASEFATIDSGALVLDLQPARLQERSQYSFIGIRQRDFEFAATTSMTLETATDRAEAGLALVQNDRSALLFTLGGGTLRLTHNRDTEVDELAVAALDGNEVQLKVTGDYLDLGFHYSADGSNWSTLTDGVDGSLLSPSRIGGYNYTGVYIGLYGSTNGDDAVAEARFDWFEYIPMADDRDNWFYRQGQQ